MTIGELARQAGVATSAIRYYERIGVLPPPDRHNGRRRYDPSALDVLTLVRFARGVGLSVSDVGVLFGRSAQRGPISRRWSRLAKTKIDAIDRQIRDLQGARMLLRGLLACRCVDPVECGRQIRSAALVQHKAPR